MQPSYLQENYDFYILAIEKDGANLFFCTVSYQPYLDSTNLFLQLQIPMTKYFCECVCKGEQPEVYFPCNNSQDVFQVLNKNHRHLFFQANQYIHSVK